MADRPSSNPRRLNRALWRILALSGVLMLFVVKLLTPHDLATTPPAIRAVPSESDQARPKTAYEPTDWSVAPVALVYLGVLVLLVVCCFVLIAAYPHAMSDTSRTLRITPPGPRLQTDPQGDLRAFRADEEKRLNSYYWMDKQKGIVHIPIVQAMQKLAKSGAPGFPRGQQ